MPSPMPNPEKSLSRKTVPVSNSLIILGAGESLIKNISRAVEYQKNNNSLFQSR